MRPYNTKVEVLPIKLDLIATVSAICPVCGKEFFPPNDDWAYKIMIYSKKRGTSGGHREKVCSYSCKKQYDEEHTPKTEKRKILKAKKELQGIM